ncbi:MAG: hypothetical protein ACPL28_11065 [bacterium]
MLLINLMLAKEIPLSLANGIGAEVGALIFYPSSKWKELGYNSYYKTISDVIIDDAGNVHIVINEHYREFKHIWCYLRYDKNANKLFKKEIYSGEYITSLHSHLNARLLINPDLTILVFYPDTSFYTCWVKLDRDGNIIERHRAEWWRAGDAKVCSAGQDSFHIVTFPIGFRTLIKQYHPLVGEFYLNVEPTLIPTYIYLNNFSIKEPISLPVPYYTIGVSSMVPLPDKRIFCFSQFGESERFGVGWFLDSNGKTYDAEKFNWKDLDKICFAKVKIDTLLTRLKIPKFLDWSYGGLFSDSTIGIAIFWRKTLFLVRYNLNGHIIQQKAEAGKLVKITEMCKEQTIAFIQQIRVPRIEEPDALHKTILYWGFDNLGNFFLQIY